MEREVGECTRSPEEGSTVVVVVVVVVVVHFVLFLFYSYSYSDVFANSILMDWCAWLCGARGSKAQDCVLHMVRLCR